MDQLQLPDLLHFRKSVSFINSGALISRSGESPSIVSN